MGKKILRQAKAKISKTSCSEKKPLNSLIKVLRPKVYITHSSSFKTLVQELTGNATVSSPSSSLSLSYSSSPRILEQPEPVLEVEDDLRNPESSTESSFDASVNSFLVWNHLALPFNDTNSLEYMFMDNQLEDSLVYGDLQAFLQLDHVDGQCLGSFNDVYSEIQQEVSIYDYELSGLI